MKRCLALFLLSFGTHVQAENSDWVTVVDIYTPVKGTPYVTFSANSLPGCYNSSGAYLSVKHDSGDGKLAYSKLLASKLSNKEVRVYYTVNDVAEDYNGWGLCSITALSLK